MGEMMQGYSASDPPRTAHEPTDGGHEAERSPRPTEGAERDAHEAIDAIIARLSVAEDAVSSLEAARERFWELVAERLGDDDALRLWARAEVETHTVNVGELLRSLRDAREGASTLHAAVTPQHPLTPRSARPRPLDRAARRGSLLVIDDDPLLGASLERLLGRDHDVTVVTRGPDAVAAVAATRFDLVLCDVLMPGMSGIETFELLRSTDPTISRRIVFISGGVPHRSVREVLARDGVPCIAKPFDIPALRALVAERVLAA